MLEQGQPEMFTNKAKAERMRARAEVVQNLANGFRNDAGLIEDEREKEKLLNNAKTLDETAEESRKEAERLENLK